MTKEGLNLNYRKISKYGLDFEMKLDKYSKKLEEGTIRKGDVPQLIKLLNMSYEFGRADGSCYREARRLIEEKMDLVAKYYNCNAEEICIDYGNFPFSTQNESDMEKKLQCKIILGRADFRKTKIQDLGELQSILGDAIFGESEITSLGKLQSIGEDADFRKSKIEDVGELKHIGGKPIFSRFTNAYANSIAMHDVKTKIYTEKQLQDRYRRLIDYNKKIEEHTITEADIPQLLDDLFLLKNYNLIEIIDDKNIIRDLEDNLCNIMSLIAQCLGCKESEICLGTFIGEFKMMTEVPYKFIIGDAYFDTYTPNIKSLNGLQAIYGCAYFSRGNVKDLGELKSIGGDAIFRETKIKSLGKLESIGGDADFIKSKIEDFGELQSIGGNVLLYFSSPRIKDLGKLQRIGGYADFNNSRLESLGELQSIGGMVDFRGAHMTSLGKLQSIGGDALFSKSDIQDLGELENIGGDVDLCDTKITSIGKLKNIGGKIKADGVVKTKKDVLEKAQKAIEENKRRYEEEQKSQNHSLAELAMVVKDVPQTEIDQAQKTIKGIAEEKGDNGENKDVRDDN